MNIFLLLIIKSAISTPVFHDSYYSVVTQSFIKLADYFDHNLDDPDLLVLVRMDRSRVSVQEAHDLYTDLLIGEDPSEWVSLHDNLRALLRITELYIKYIEREDVNTAYLEQSLANAISIYDWLEWVSLVDLRLGKRFILNKIVKLNNDIHSKRIKRIDDVVDFFNT